MLNVLADAVKVLPYRHPSRPSQGEGVKRKKENEKIQKYQIKRSALFFVFFEKLE